MTITRQDIKLLASQELSDASTGGGLMTTNEVVDGEINNLFADISRLDRTLGRVSLRKAFAAVQTADNSEYYGAHAILTAPASDPAVDVTLFSTEDDTDKRPNAQQEIEAYVIRAAELPAAILYGFHPQGMATITLISLSDQQLPKIGDTLEIIQDIDEPGEFSQFVKTGGKTQQQTLFIDNGIEYTRYLTTYETTEPLDYNFDGGTPSRLIGYTKGAAVIHVTTASASAEYFGIRSLSSVANALQSTINIDSIFAQVTPTAQSETVLADAVMGGDLTRVLPAGSSEVSISAIILPRFVITNISLGGAITRGSLKLSGQITAHDDGAGALVYVSGNSFDSAVVDYEQGTVTLDNDSNSSLVNFAWVPAASLSDVSDTMGIKVTPATRAQNYVQTLRPIPAPGTLIVEYMAQGNWHTLRDKGGGVLIGDIEGIGTGVADYATGTVIMTLAALPDVGSEILLYWGGANHYEIRDTAEVKKIYISHTVPEGAIVPNSLTITWLSSGITKTATDNGSGELTGDATGGVIYSTGEIAFLPTLLPDPNATITYDYDYGTVQSENFTPSKDGGGNITLNLANASAIKPYSIEVILDFTNKAELEKTVFISTNVNVMIFGA